MGQLENERRNGCVTLLWFRRRALDTLLHGCIHKGAKGNLLVRDKKIPNRRRKARSQYIHFHAVPCNSGYRILGSVVSKSQAVFPDTIISVYATLALTRRGKSEKNGHIRKHPFRQFYTSKTQKSTSTRMPKERERHY